MMRDSWDTIITTAEATATIWKITPKFTVARKRYTKKFFDELNSDDQRLQDPELTVKTHIFLAIVDTALHGTAEESF